MFITSLLEQGLIFAILAIGVMITYKILDFPDLSVDGTFILGASITASFLVKDVNPYEVLLIAFILGGIAGFFTGVLHVYLKISHLLSGILVMIGLYSINLRIMGRPNIQFFNHQTVFSNTSNKLIQIIIIVLLIKILFDLYLKTRAGLMLKMAGDNPNLVTTLGENIGKIKIIGLMLSNALVALSGSLFAQYQRFTDINAGTGTIIIGLTSVIIGETVLKLGKRPFHLTTMAIIGSLFYKFCQGFTLELGFSPTDFKLISAMLIIILLGLRNIHVKSLKGRKEKTYVRTTEYQKTI